MPADFVAKTDLERQALEVVIAGSVEPAAAMEAQAEPAPLVGDEGEALTRDVHLQRILGSQPLTDGSGLKATSRVAELTVRGVLGSLGAELRAYVSGYPTVGLQISGTWTGTIVFEATVDGGNWVSALAAPIAGGTLAASTTAVGAWLISAAGVVAVRARVSAAATGAALCTFVASAAAALARQSAGSLAPLSQKASTLELNTYDTNVLALLGSANLVRPISDVPVGPVAPVALTAAQLLACPTRDFGKPQILPRVRVEAGGSEKLPFAQQSMTNEIRISSDMMVRQLEALTLQIYMLTQAMMASGLINCPPGFE